MRHPSSQRFHEILAGLGELHDLKQGDYGTNSDPFANVRATEEWGIPAWVGAMIRGNDKIQRMKSMVRNGKVNNEAIEDSFRDLAVYAIIALVLFEEQEQGKPFEEQLVEEFLSVAEDKVNDLVGNWDAYHADQPAFSTEDWPEEWEENPSQPIVQGGAVVQLNDNAPNPCFVGFFGVVTDIEENSMWPYKVDIAPTKHLWLARHEFELV